MAPCLAFLEILQLFSYCVRSFVIFETQAFFLSLETSNVRHSNAVCHFALQNLVLLGTITCISSPVLVHILHTGRKNQVCWLYVPAYHKFKNARFLQLFRLSECIWSEHIWEENVTKNKKHSSKPRNSKNDARRNILKTACNHFQNSRQWVN